MPTSRLEAFSDGVFAIAATLLILNVQAGGPHLAQALGRIWPSYVAYAVSFVTIGIIWVNHHTVMALIAKVDRVFLMLHVLFLMRSRSSHSPRRCSPRTSGRRARRRRRCRTGSR